MNSEEKTRRKGKKGKRLKIRVFIMLRKQFLSTLDIVS